MTAGQAALLGLALTLTVSVVELVRRRRLREEFSGLWLVGAALITAMAVFGPRLATALGLSLATLLGLLLAAMALLVTLDLSIRVSAMETRLKNLAQQLALVQKRTADLEADDER